jgi:hypothetical protein
MDYQVSKPVRGKALDFAGALIVHKARSGVSEDGQALERFYSFDKAVEQLKWVKPQDQNSGVINDNTTTSHSSQG